MKEMSGFKLAPSRLNRPPASDDAVASPATKTNFVGELNFLNPTPVLTMLIRSYGEQARTVG